MLGNAQTLFGNYLKAYDLGLIEAFEYKEEQWGPKSEVNGVW